MGFIFYFKIQIFFSNIYAELITGKIKWNDKIESILNKKYFREYKKFEYGKSKYNGLPFLIVEGVKLDTYNNLIFSAFDYPNGSREIRYSFNNNGKMYSSDEVLKIYTDLYSKISNKYGRNEYVSNAIPFGFPVWKISKDTLLKLSFDHNDSFKYYLEIFMCEIVKCNSLVIKLDYSKKIEL